MFPNLDQTLNQAFQERGMNVDVVPMQGPGGQDTMQAGGNALPFMQSPQATTTPTSPQATMPLPRVAGQLAAKLTSSDAVQKAKNALPILATGLAAGGIAIGAIYLARRLEHGPAKKDENHLRLDAATIAPVVAAVVIGVIVILVLRKIRDMSDAVQNAAFIASMQPQAQPGFQFTPQGQPALAVDPVEAELQAAQALMAGMTP